jgi:hypothetical protein
MGEPQNPASTPTPIFSAARALAIILGRPLLDAARVAVSPDIVRKNALVALIDRIRDGLPDPVIAEDGDSQVALGQKIKLFLAVIAFAQGTLHFEMIAATGQFEALIAPVRRLLGELFQRAIQPRQRE